jgi:hypothetical protein
LLAMYFEVIYAKGLVSGCPHNDDFCVYKGEEVPRKMFPDTRTSR